MAAAVLGVLGLVRPPCIAFRAPLMRNRCHGQQGAMESFMLGEDLTAAIAPVLLVGNSSDTPLLPPLWCYCGAGQRRGGG